MKHDFSSYSTRLVAIFGKVRPDTAVVVFLFSFNRILFSACGSLVAHYSESFGPHRVGFLVQFFLRSCVIYTIQRKLTESIGLLSQTPKKHKHFRPNTHKGVRARNTHLLILSFFCHFFCPFLNLHILYQTI